MVFPLLVYLYPFFPSSACYPLSSLPRKISPIHLIASYNPRILLSFLLKVLISPGTVSHNIKTCEKVPNIICHNEKIQMIPFSQSY